MKLILAILHNLVREPSRIYYSEKQLDHPVTIEEWHRTMDRLS